MLIYVWVTQPHMDLARESLIDLLEAENVLTDEDVAEAMRAIRREDYFDDASRSFSYAPQDVQISDHILALNPRTIAEILSIARPSEGMRVLVLGTSTGYVEAILHRIGCRIDIIEPNEAHRAYVHERLEKTEVPARFIELSEAGTYDLVISLKSIPRIEPRLLGFTPYGRTMIVIGDEHTLIALDYRGEPTQPEVSYSGSVWLPFFDPPLFDEELD